MKHKSICTHEEIQQAKKKHWLVIYDIDSLILDTKSLSALIYH